MLSISGWLRGGRLKSVRRDRCSLAVLMIPEKVSHAHLVGLWPRVGLYSSIAAALGCAMFGGSRFLVGGTNPSLAILMAGSISSVAVRDPALTETLAALTAGLIALPPGLCVWGLSNLMSKSVLIGFDVGAGLRSLAAIFRNCMGSRSRANRPWCSWWAPSNTSPR